MTIRVRSYCYSYGSIVEGPDDALPGSILGSADEASNADAMGEEVVVTAKCARSGQTKVRR